MYEFCFLKIVLKLFNCIAILKKIGAGAVILRDGGAVILGGGGIVMLLILLYDEATLFIINFEPGKELILLLVKFFCCAPSHLVRYSQHTI